jgi:RNA polymerase sigma-70 factor (ECF subfamily)
MTPARTTPAGTTFEDERSRLFGLAYRMLGSVADAEDVVQDAYLRWAGTDQSGVREPAAWLTTVTTRLALDRLRRVQRERADYVGPWLPEPLLTAPEPDPGESVLLAESLTLGVLTVLERLEPVERAVFVLREVFDEPYPSIAGIVGRSEAACRQLVHRARERVRAERATRVVSPARRDELVAAFARAIAAADVDGLRQMLADDVVLISDGGADHHAARRPVVGADRVSRFIVNITKRLRDPIELRLVTVNLQPGFLAVLRGRPLNLTVLELDDSAIRGIRNIVNPAKLRAVMAGLG